MSGGSKSGPSQVTNVQTNIPKFAEPYYEDLLQRTVYETQRPYQPYTGQRVADFTDVDRQALAGFQQMASHNGPVDQAFAHARDTLTAVRGWQPTEFSNTYQAGQRNSGFQAQSYSPAYRAGQISPTYRAQGITSQFSVDPYSSAYSARQFDPGFEAGSMADEGAIEQYMNPYQQAVTDIAKRELERQRLAEEQRIGNHAAMAGGLGGYREAIMQAELGRNTSQQMNDLQMQGSHQAFINAQQAYEADRQARLAGANLGLSAQELADRSAQQAEAFRQGAYGLSMEGQALGEQFRQSAYDLTDRGRQAQQQFGLDAFQLNEQARQMQEQFGLDAFDMNTQNRSLAEQYAQRAFEINEANRQRQADLTLTEQQLRDQSRQALGRFNLDAAGMLMDGAAEYERMLTGRFTNLAGAGQVIRDQRQAQLDANYADWQAQQAYPMEQLALYNNVLRGLPIQPGSTTSVYGGGPSTTQQMLGSGLSLIGMYNATRR